MLKRVILMALAIVMAAACGSKQPASETNNFVVRQGAGFVFDPASPTTARDRYYDFVFSLIETEPTIYGCNFWGWGGEARPQHEQWRGGQPSGLYGLEPHLRL